MAQASTPEQAGAPEGAVVQVRLRDGSPALIRPIRPQDKAKLLEGFERLSAESRYRRFLAATSKLDARTLRYLCEVDHHDHEALVALGPSGEGIGVARYVRTSAAAESAEAAVTVADDWQGRGAGTALLSVLADRARAEGIRRMTALMLADNRRMLEVLEELGPVQIVARAGNTVEVAVELPPQGPGPHLREQLRGTAVGRYELRPGAGVTGQRRARGPARRAMLDTSGQAPD